jgi:hypothetical protein
VSRLYVNKAQMISIGNALSEQLGERAAAGSTLLCAPRPGRLHCTCARPACTTDRLQTSRP